MGIETTIYTPRTLGKLVRRMPPVHTFFRDTFFKNRRTFNTKSVDVDFKKGSRALAPFVHPKVGGKTILNTGYQTKSYTPVLLAPNKITTVDDLLERAAGEDPYSGRKPAERAVEKLAEDLRELNEMIVRREEWMAATAIFTGQIPIVGEGVNEVIDFDFTNKETIVSAEKKWDNAQSDPLADIERWHEIVQREGFVNCNVCVMAKDVATAFINHAKVKEVLDVKAYADAPAWKKTQNINDKAEILCWPLFGLGDYVFHASVHTAARMTATDSDNGGCPAESPSNKSLQIDRACLADGTTVLLDLNQANYLNSNGIVTALNFIGGYVLWGNETACFPADTDVKNYFIPVSRMFGWVANSLVLSYWSKLDKKMTRRLIDSIVNSVNIWLNGLVNEEKLLGGRVEFLEEENSETALMAGKAVFHIYMTPPSPMKECEFVLEYDADYVSSALAA